MALIKSCLAGGSSAPTFVKGEGGSLGDAGSNTINLYTASGNARLFVNLILHASSAVAGDTLVLKKNSTDVDSISLASGGDAAKAVTVDVASGDVVTAVATMTGSTRLVYAASVSEI